MFRKAATLLASLALVATAAPAMASSTQRFRADAGSDGTISISACSPRVRVAVRGDGDTDLDFYLYGSDGTLIFTDTDGTDYTSTDVTTGVPYGARYCVPLTLRVRNYGGVYNIMTISIIDL